MCVERKSGEAGDGDDLSNKYVNKTDFHFTSAACKNPDLHN